MIVYLQTCVLFTTSKLKKPKSISYTAELSLPEHFDIPKKIYIPQITETQTKLTQPQGIQPANKTGNQYHGDCNILFCPRSCERLKFRDYLY